MTCGSRDLSEDVGGDPILVQKTWAGPLCTSCRCDNFVVR